MMTKRDAWAAEAMRAWAAGDPIPEPPPHRKRMPLVRRIIAWLNRLVKLRRYGGDS